MFDDRNVNSDYPNSNDPLRYDTRAGDPDQRVADATWRWIAAAVFVVVVLAVAFGFSHAPSQAPDRVANNNAMSPPHATTAPPAGPAPNSPASPTYTPPKNGPQ